MIKTTSTLVTATGSELLLAFLIFIRGENLYPYSWKSVGHLSKYFDTNDSNTEEQGTAL